MVLLGSLLSRKIIFYFEDMIFSYILLLKKPLAIFPLVTLFICHKRKSYQIVSSGTNIGICKKKYKYHVQFFFYIIKILYLGLSFLGHPQNYKYYNITFVIFHDVIIKFRSSKYCIFFRYKVVQYSVVRILDIFLLQSCTKWSSKYCIFFSYKVVQNGPSHISSIFCLLNEVDYTCYQQHIIISFVCYFVNSFMFALIMHREY